jgi:hypothetical protein
MIILLHSLGDYMVQGIKIYLKIYTIRNRIMKQ